MLVYLAAGAMRLTCTLQGVSQDGFEYVGPKYQVTLLGENDSVMTRESTTVTLVGVEALGLASSWKTTPNFHGSVLLLPFEDGDPLSGVLIPMRDGAFSIFWANGDRLKADGAPITKISGTCAASTNDAQREITQ